MRQNKGLTLIGVLISFAILAAFGTLAIQATGDLTRNLQDVRNRKATLELLDQVKRAIVGLPGVYDADGALKEVPSFVSDMGTLPLTANAGNQANALRALWSDFGGALPAYSQLFSPSDSEVSLQGGWRGPYLSPPEGGNLLDAWGSPINVLASNEATVVGANQLSEVIVSLGANGALGSSASPLSEDLLLKFNSIVSSVNQYQGSLQGIVTVSSGGGPLNGVSVYYFAPNPLTGDLLEVSVAAVFDPVINAYRYTFPNPVTIGSRVLRAYFNPSGAAPPDPATVGVVKGVVTYVTITAGQQQQDLEIQ